MLVTLLVVVLFYCVSSQIYYENCEPLTSELSVQWTVDKTLNGVYYNLVGTNQPVGSRII